MENITATSALVSWGPPPDANGVIISYTVNFVIVELVTEASGNVSGSRRKRQVGNSIMECVVGSGDNVDRNVTVDGNQTSTTLSDLSELEVCLSDLIISCRTFKYSHRNHYITSIYHTIFSFDNVRTCNTPVYCCSSNISL